MRKADWKSVIATVGSEHVQAPFERRVPFASLSVYLFGVVD